jgi:hypothetical protein
VFLIETFIAVGSLAYSLPNTRREGCSENRICIVSTDSGNCFQVSSGCSLEADVKSDLQNIDGVQHVEITNEGNNYTVTVTLRELEFSVFDQVINKELELFDQHSDKTFKFDIRSASLDSRTQILHAA